MQDVPPAGLSSREKILWAAATMLGDDPASSPSVRAVAARAGVSAGSVQHHFPNQRALLDEVLIRLYDHLLPDDSVHDASIPAKDRLVAFLQRLLRPQPDAADLREEWVKVFDRYVRAAPTGALREEYIAVERALRRRIESCLVILESEGSLASGDNDRRARFLYTLLSGLSIANALPADADVPPLQVEVDILHLAAEYVLSEQSQR